MLSCTHCFSLFLKLSSFLSSLRSVFSIIIPDLINSNSPASTIKTIDHDLHCHHFYCNNAKRFIVFLHNYKVKKKICCFNKFSPLNKCFHGFDPKCVLNIDLINSSSPASTRNTFDHDLHCYHFMVTMQGGS